MRVKKAYEPFKNKHEKGYCEYAELNNTFEKIEALKRQKCEETEINEYPRRFRFVFLACFQF